MSNLTKIDKILARTSTIEVFGETLDLVLPKAEEIRELRSLQFSAAKFSEDDFRGDEALNQLSQYTTKCVQYCLCIDEDSATSLIFATGGEAGFLFKQVQEFLGLSSTPDDGTIDDPL